MKKILKLVVATMFLGVFSVVSAAQKKVLGIVMPNATHGFLGESIKHAKLAADEYAKNDNLEYKFMTSAEASEQNNQMDSLINEKVDAIVLWPHNGNELRSAALKVKDSKIPLVVYDRLIDGVQPTVEVMGDNFTIGENTAKYFNNYFAEDLKKGKVHILEFKGDDSTVPQQRSDGFKKMADKNINIVQQFSTGWQRAKAQEQMETFLNSAKKEEVENLKGVFTHDDEVVLGVIDAIMNYNGPAKLNIKLVTGVGGRKENIETFDIYKKNLNLDQVTFLFSPTMVRDAVKIGSEIAQGSDKYSGLILIPTETIDNNNYKKYMESDAWKVRYEN